MNNTTRDLLEQLNRLADYVRHQGDAGKAGVPASPDHLIYLAENMRMAVQQLASAIEDQAAEQARMREALAALPAGRNERLIEGYARVAKVVREARFVPVYGFDERSVSLGTLHNDGNAMGLIEWYYLLHGPKAVRKYLYDDGTAIMSVDGTVDHHAVSVSIRFRDDAAVSLIKQCAQPSIHLLRRLQIAGAR